MVTDPIANLLTIVRNGLQAKHAFVYVPHSKIKEAMIAILKTQGYIHNYQVEQEPAPQGRIKVILKYQPQTKKPAIVELTRISTPGRRQYTQVDDIPHVVNGLGIAILSTSQGVMTGKQAKQKRLGGEILCHVF